MKANNKNILIVFIQKMSLNFKVYKILKIKIKVKYS